MKAVLEGGSDKATIYLYGNDHNLVDIIEVNAIIIAKYGKIYVKSNDSIFEIVEAIEL